VPVPAYLKEAAVAYRFSQQPVMQTSHIELVLYVEVTVLYVFCG
jgi:hypothetical protein